MEESTKKRVRSSNWEEEEKRLLRQLVIARIDVIENNDSSTNTNNSKRAAWQEVLSSFNSLNRKKRDLKEIMTQWRNAKGKVKSRDSEYKRARLMTGGGPPPPSPPAEDLVIMEALPNEFIVDSNCFDSDGLHNNGFSQPSTSGSQSKNTDCDDPWTPLLVSSNDVNDNDVEEIPDVSTSEIKTILSSTPKPREYYQRKLKNNNKVQAIENYEEELFLLTKKSKEREYERAEEIHKKRIAILDLEYEYWKKKTSNID